MATVTFSNANYIECKTTKTNKKKGHKPMHSAPIEKVMLLACNQRFEIGNSSRWQRTLTFHTPFYPNGGHFLATLKQFTVMFHTPIYSTTNICGKIKEVKIHCLMWQTIFPPTDTHHTLWQSHFSTKTSPPRSANIFLFEKCNLFPNCMCKWIVNRYLPRILV